MKKKLSIQSVKLIFSSNSRISVGWMALIQIEGRFPGARKIVRITTTPMDGYVWLHPLNGYSGSAKVCPADWRRIMSKAEIVQDHQLPILISQHMIDKGREKYIDEYLESIQNKLNGCNADRASRNLSELVTEFDPVEFI